MSDEGEAREFLTRFLDHCRREDEVAKTEEGRPLTTCVHEAGHAVIATLEEVPVLCVKAYVFPEEVIYEEGLGGETFFDDYYGSTPKKGFDLVVSLIRVDIAGSIAEAMLAGLEYEQAEGRRINAHFMRTVVDRFTTTGRSDWQHAYKLLLLLDTYDEEYPLEGVVDKMIWNVFNALKTRWTTVMELARLVRANGQIHFYDHPFLIGEGARRRQYAERILQAKRELRGAEISGAPSGEGV